jgi:hypothetical protein
MQHQVQKRIHPEDVLHIQIQTGLLGQSGLSNQREAQKALGVVID